MASFDRTSNVPHLKDTFPALVGMTSEQVQAFLNDESGLKIESTVPNGIAFDRWRKALAKRGYPELWTYTQADIDRINALVVKNLE